MDNVAGIRAYAAYMSLNAQISGNNRSVSPVCNGSGILNLSRSLFVTSIRVPLRATIKRYRLSRSARARKQTLYDNYELKIADGSVARRTLSSTLACPADNIFIHFAVIVARREITVTRAFSVFVSLHTAY